MAVKGESPVAKCSTRLFFLGVTALLLLAVPPTASGADDFKPAACVDNTPHEVRMVEVAPGVELEVIDWGGSGPPMVLLTGLGDNAHVYDQFAFQFTDDFRVIGITRRGFLPSSQPRDGYDVPTRAADDIAVLDAMGIEKAVFVGHSLAGSELSRLGSDYPDRVEKLVYLDASDLAERFQPGPGRAARGAAAVHARYPEVVAGLPGGFGAIYRPAGARCGRLPQPRVQCGGRDRRCHVPGPGSRRAAGRSSGEPADGLDEDQCAAAGHLRPLHRRGEAGLVLLPGSGAAGRIRRCLAADHGLVQHDGRQVRRGKRGQHPPALGRPSLRLHQRRGGGGPVDAGVLGRE